MEPLVIKGLSHSINLEISFFLKHNLKINCTEEEVKKWVSLESPVGRRKIS